MEFLQKVQPINATHHLHQWKRPSTEEALWESKEELRVVHYNQGELVPRANEEEDNDKSFNQFNPQQGPNARSATEQALRDFSNVHPHEVSHAKIMYDNGLSKDMTAPGSLQSP